MLTGLGQGDASGEALKSTIKCLSLNDFVFSPDEEIFMDTTGIPMLAPG